jgi:hypothetical protein
MNETEPSYFEIKDTGDYIRIELLKLSYPDSAFDFDRNCIKSIVTVKAGGFNGHFDCELMTTDFVSLNTGLSKLYDKLSGVASFNTIEGQVEMKITGDGIGHFTADCSVMDNEGIGNTLEFEITFDQTLIPEMLNQLENILKDFPVTGDLKK